MLVFAMLVLAVTAGAADAAPKEDAAAPKKGASAPRKGAPAPVPLPSPAPVAPAARAPLGEIFVAPSVASLGERWADGMTGGRLGAAADRRAWTPSVAFGVRTPVGRALAVEADGATTRFAARVPGGRTEGWVGHAAGRVSWDRGRLGVEAGLLARIAEVSAPGGGARMLRVLPSLEGRLFAESGVEVFAATWNDPLLPYGDAGWLRVGARRALTGRLSGELAFGVDSMFVAEDAGAPVVESRLELAAGKGTWIGLACRAADEPMAALLARRTF